MNFIVSKEDLSPIYNSEAEALNSLLKSTKSFEEKLEAFKTFSEKYTVVPSFIWLAKRYTQENRDYDISTTLLLRTDLLESKEAPASCHYLQTIEEIMLSNIITKSLVSAVDKHRWRKLVFFNFKLVERGSPSDDRFIQYPNGLKRSLLIAELYRKFLSFPSSRLTEYYSYCEMHSASPLSKEMEEKYQQSLILYEKVKESHSNIEEWIECLKEINDLNFIIQNVECRIGKSPFAKEIWKIYIQYLKDFQISDLMYHTYSRYCSLFIDDLEMRQKFKSEVEASSDESLSKWKLDVVKIEKNFGTLETAISLFKTYFPSSKTEINAETFESEFKKVWAEKRRKSQSPLLKYISDEPNLKPSILRKSEKCLFKNDAIHQTFSLPSTAINFMIKNAEYQHLQKLYETSKYFFVRVKSPLCYKLKIGVSPNTVSFQQSLFISSNSDAVESDGIQKCHVKEMIHIQKTPPLIVSSIITNKIYKSEILTLSLLAQSINYGDFLKIISTVQTFYVKDAYVFDEEGRNISVPEIVAEMPSIKTVRIVCLYKHPPFPPNSNLPKMGKKLEKFECRICNGPNDFKIMCQFLTESLASNAIVDICFYTNPDEAETAKICILEMFELWKKDETFKPNAKIEFGLTVYYFL